MATTGRFARIVHPLPHRPALLARACWLALATIVCMVPNVTADTANPLEGITSGSVYNYGVTIQLAGELRDKNIKIILNGVECPPGTVVQAEGDYLVEFSTDDAELAASLLPVDFGIDMTMPEITFEWSKKSQGKGIPKVEVKDENFDASDPAALRLYLDGQQYTAGQTLDPGKHRFDALATDLAGNASTKSVTVAITDCPPDKWIEYVRPNSTLVAAHFFSWYRQGYNGLWRCVDIPERKIEPARGYYDSSSQSVAIDQMNEMKRNGIDVVAVEWTDSATLQTNVHDTTIPAIGSSNMPHFVMLYDLYLRFQRDPNFNDPYVRNVITSDFQTFATDSRYFRHSKYLKLGNNRPVVYFYVTRAIQGSEANIRSTFDSLQSIARANGFGGIYVVADHLYWGSINYDLLRQIGAHATTAFAPVDRNQGVPMDLPQDNPGTRPMRTWADKLVDLYGRAKSRLESYTQGIDMQPGIFVQYDDQGFDNTACTQSFRNVMAYHVRDTTDWQYMIQNAGNRQRYIAEIHEMRPSCRERVTTNSGYQSIIWVYSYNEWGEGAGIEQLTQGTPRCPYRFGLDMLDTLKNTRP